MKNRILAGWIILCMVLSMMPMTAFAQETECEHAYDGGYYDCTDDGHAPLCDLCGYFDESSRQPHIDEDGDGFCNVCGSNWRNTVGVDLYLKAVDANGTEIVGHLEAVLSPAGTYIGTELRGYDTSRCEVGENTVSNWDNCPDGYAKPTEDITFTCDETGKITVTGGNATVETVDGAVYLVVTLFPPALEITEQPDDATATLGENFCVTVEAVGDDLRYQWYFRKVGAESWTRSGQRDNTYDDVMTAARANREVYCVITDAWGNSVTTDTATLIPISETP